MSSPHQCHVNAMSLPCHWVHRALVLSLYRDPWVGLTLLAPLRVSNSLVSFHLNCSILTSSYPLIRFILLRPISLDSLHQNDSIRVLRWHQLPLLGLLYAMARSRYNLVTLYLPHMFISHNLLHSSIWWLSQQLSLFLFSSVSLYSLDFPFWCESTCRVWSLHPYRINHGCSSDFVSTIWSPYVRLSINLTGLYRLIARAQLLHSDFIIVICWISF